MSKAKNNITLILMFLCEIALCLILIFSVLIFNKNPLWLNIIIYLVLAILMISLVWGFYLKKETIFRLSVVLSIFFVILYFGYYILTKKGIIEQISSFQDIKKLILGFKGWGLFSYTILNLLQVVLIPIPSTLTILAGTAIYGPLMAFIFASIGILAGSIIAFLIGRFCSKPILIWIFGENKINKYEKLLSKHTKLFLFLMLVLPFFPDDLICMLAGITDLKLKDFLWISLVSRSIGVATISFFGSGSIIPFDKGWGIACWSVILVLLVVGGIIAYKKRTSISKVLVRISNKGEKDN